MNNIRKIYSLLYSAYGPQGWWPVQSCAGKPGFTPGGYHPGIYDFPQTHAQRWEIIAGAVLTQNTNWRNAAAALKEVSQADKLNAESLVCIKEEDLACLIRSSGYFRQKAKKLQILASFFLSHDNESGIVPDRDSLLQIWGIGPETADSILLYAYQIPVFVIDAYTKRLFSRLKLCNAEVSYNVLQNLIMSQLPKDIRLFNEYHALIVEHAKRFCQSKPQCRGCPLESICPSCL